MCFRVAKVKSSCMNKALSPVPGLLRVLEHPPLRPVCRTPPHPTPTPQFPAVVLSCHSGSQICSSSQPPSGVSGHIFVLPSFLLLAFTEPGLHTHPWGCLGSRDEQAALFQNPLNFPIQGQTSSQTLVGEMPDRREAERDTSGQGLWPPPNRGCSERKESESRSLPSSRHSEKHSNFQTHAKFM